MAMNVLSGIVRIVSGRHIGTGFVVTADGLILTCAHVLGSSMPEKARVVFLGSGEEREVTVLAEGWRAVDAEDVAVLRVVAGGHPTPAARVFSGVRGPCDGYLRLS